MDDRLKRIEEIEKQRNELAKERDAIRKEIDDENKKEKYNKRMENIGKCFVLKKGLKSESFPNVIAFKILSIDSEEKSQYARCLTITSGYRYTCWPEKGIINQVLSLWFYDTNRMMHKPTDKCTIELFEEIPEEEFNKLKEEAYKTIEEEPKEKSTKSIFSK